MNEDPIKVLSVCTSDSVGGASRAAYRIHQGVRGLGVQSRMLVKYKQTTDPDVIALDAFAPKCSFYKAFDWVREKGKNKLQHLRWSRYAGHESVFMSDLRGVDLHGALEKLNYDVLHLHWINLRFVSLSDLPKGKPLVWTLHDSWPFCGVCHSFFDCEGFKKECGCCPQLRSSNPNDLSHKIWKRKSECYKDMDLHIVCPSQWLADSVRQSSLFGGFPITVIPNCLDVDVFRPFDQENKNEKQVVLFGAIKAIQDKRKGFDKLLSALRLLEHSEHKNDFEVVVFGAAESELNVDLDIPIHCVGLLDNTEELVSLYSKANVMVVPSLSEVFGQTASEAMACGTPVVAFRCTGIQEVVDHKVNGYLARPFEPEDLANGILWCLNNNEGNMLGKAAREKVLREYAMVKVGGQYKELYESINNHHQS